MDIYKAINKLSPKKKTYARWRFNLEYDKSKEKHTPERLCEILGVKTLSEYIKWENSNQFLGLTNLYLQTKFANDIEDVYLATVEKAKEGDVQSVKLMLQLQKEIKAANRENNKKNPNDDMFDDLELD
ncbi:hypothetical protein [Sporosarcina aquimarina]|uniref:hypothetical protein n=1 Tax=Sporosarcina aquimarina TaxID=114975 RepID=UPI001C8E73D0|nr:hypothetical protein [Sporosarcina aquimarina]MBY0221959.1 hypothetical protein [Sporosarcina aquimarina]